VAVKSLGYAFVSGDATSSSSGTTTPVSIYPMAARDLSAHRVVVLTPSGVDYPNLAAMESGDAVLGITTGAVASGASAAYQFEGALSDPSWAWTVGPLFCGASGVLTQAPPTSGLWLRQVGSAIGATMIEINLYPTYYLRN